MEKGALDQVRKGITTYISKILAKIKSKNVSFSELLSILWFIERVNHHTRMIMIGLSLLSSRDGLGFLGE